MHVKLGTQSIRTIAAFEKITEVHAKDCIISEDCVYFLVDPENVGIAIGKSGSTIRELRRVFGKTVKVFGYYKSPDLFIRHAFPKAKAVEINSNGITVTIPEEDKVTAIGRNGRNIKAVRDILYRHFSVKNLKVK